MPGSMESPLNIFLPRILKACGLEVREDILLDS